MQLRRWIAETTEGATWSHRFDELLRDVVREGERGDGPHLDLERARQELQNHVWKSRCRMGELLR